MAERTQPAEEVLLEADVDDEALARPSAADPAEVLAFAAHHAALGERVWIATVTARRGSAPSTPGQKLAWASASGAALGTIGGGALERAVLRRMLALDETARGPFFRTESCRLGQSFGMCCGGGVDILYEGLAEAPCVLIVGAGHVAQATAPLLASAGFVVTVVDERDEWVSRLANVARITAVAGDFRSAGRGLSRSASVVAMTHDHHLDQDVVEWALAEGFAFVGGVGSRAKAVRLRERLSHKGFPAETLARVRMPVGVDIGSRTPAELAVSIAAELIAARRQEVPA